ncbi:1-phosphofructokinase family hexose kinase [Pseudonocardia sichuanensis]
MIVTLTPNPSVDRTVFVDALPHGAVVRSTDSWSEPSGKGVNVALALNTHGVATAAVLPLGGPVGAQLTQMLRAARLPFHAVPIAGDIRSNISIVEPDGTVTKINEAGPELTTAEVAHLVSTALEHATTARWLAGCGSLPAGVPVEFYATLVQEGRRRGVLVAVDTSGHPLHAVLDAGPDLVKPNDEELAEAAGVELHTLGDAVAAAQKLRARGVRAVLASLGPDGALLVDASGVLHGEAPAVPIVSTVGAGDALLAGFLAAGGSGRDALARGLRWAAAAVQHRGTLFGGSDDAVPVTITADPPLDRRLRAG